MFRLPNRCPSASVQNPVSFASKTASSLSKARITVRANGSPVNPSLRGYGTAKPIPTHFMSRSTLPIIARNLATGSKKGGKVAAGVQSAEIVEDKPDQRVIANASKDLVALCETEIQAIQDFETDSIHAETAQKWLGESGYKMSTLSEKDSDGDSITNTVLTKQIGNTLVEVKFVPWEEDEAEADNNLDPDQSMGQEMDRDHDEDDDESPDEPEAEDDIPEDSGLPNTQAVTIKLTIGDASGASKGEVQMKGFAGVDNRLYIREIEAKKPGSNETTSTLLSELSGDLQDKMYDYLDGLGVDDNMAFFIKQEIIRDRSKSDINFLKTFKDIMS